MSSSSTPSLPRTLSGFSAIHDPRFLSLRLGHSGHPRSRRHAQKSYFRTARIAPKHLDRSSTSSSTTPALLLPPTFDPNSFSSTIHIETIRLLLLLLRIPIIVQLTSVVVEYQPDRSTRRRRSTLSSGLIHPRGGGGEAGQEGEDDRWESLEDGED